MSALIPPTAKNQANIARGRRAMLWALLVAAGGISAFVAPLRDHAQQGLALATRSVLTTKPAFAEGRAHVVLYERPQYDDKLGMSSIYAASNIAFVSLVTLPMGVLFSVSPNADWATGVLFALFLLNMVSTLGKTLDAVTCLTEASAYSRDSAEYERCVQAGALRVEAGEMTASELAFFKPPCSTPDRAFYRVAPSVAPELFHFQALVTELAGAFTCALHLPDLPLNEITGAPGRDGTMADRMSPDYDWLDCLMQAEDTRIVITSSMFTYVMTSWVYTGITGALFSNNAFLLLQGYLATSPINTVLTTNAYLLKMDARGCERRGYAQRVQAEARKAQVGVSDLVEHARPPRTMLEPIRPHVARLFRFQATVGALASVFNGGEVLAGVVPASEKLDTFLGPHGCFSDLAVQLFLGYSADEAGPRIDIVKEALASIDKYNSRSSGDNVTD